MEKTVLLIEDDLVLSENTKELLELSGYRVLSSYDGKCGLKKAFHEIPDIIVSDIMMPDLDGYDVYKGLQNNRKTCNIPFIFLSAKSNPGDVRKGMNLGADDYITKPFNEEDLILAIEKRLEKRDKLLPNKKDRKKQYSEIQLEILKEHFRTYGEQLEAEKNEEIFLEGRNASNIYLLEFGLLKTFRLDEYGKELITGIGQKGDFSGFYSFKSSSTYPENATALERSILFRISHEEFVHMLEQNQELMLEYAELLSTHLDILRTHLLEMAYGSVLKKTASTLLEFVKKTNTGAQHVLKISRSDMASVAGISTESFIRSLSALKNQGIIDIIGRNIKILDPKKLHNIH
ncbi:response regulator [Salinimicrobium xinjiangense]|uniref:response regulator n=1 Tax=Salinimicrobium xinjiangense TaxID=438596 RepID=UPI000410BF92|nr:response regulator [Salinimicrobium xinjiangense]